MSHCEILAAISALWVVSGFVAWAFAVKKLLGCKSATQPAPRPSPDPEPVPAPKPEPTPDPQPGGLEYTSEAMESISTYERAFRVVLDDTAAKFAHSRVKTNIDGKLVIGCTIVVNPMDFRLAYEQLKRDGWRDNL